MTRTLSMVLLAFTVVSSIPIQTSAQITPDAIWPDGIWYFRVDRAWDGPGRPSFPTSLLAESAYHPVSNGPTYRIAISGTPQQGYQISIDDPPMKGQLLPGPIRVFDLHEGTVAGGRFIIMQGKDGLEGELTIYGSGLPIIKSERG